ncbi:hypothetical protein [Cryptosporangium phraense]|uniref:Uncharacterized protein n=1 Tax=Cryptosporangium phraense TaxID=2593070 RepID=A0A545AKJ1_9ACTN|nr:hypothetical protein [Cryptosporangium phraense]TQS41847.1 hypothetical protein FL583_27860 [Cryptosporangium phraense]
MNTGPQNWHEELRPPTPVLRRGAFAGRPVRPAVARPLPTTVLWRWRYEAALLGGAPLFWWGSVHAVGGLVGLSFVTALLAFVALVPPLRRWAFAVLWTIVTPHRIRVACAQAGLVSHTGKLPAVLVTCRKAYGERVYLWCPDGVSAGDVAAARSVFMGACWARDVRVFESSGQYPRVVAMEVVRQRTAEPTPQVPALWARFERHSGRFEGF